MQSALHLLVVDDDQEIRTLLARFLDQHGFRTTAARDAREFRRFWPSASYALVILDLMLPGESGLDLARWLRGQSTVPIIMLTAMGDEPSRIAGLDLGADDYVAKPFSPRELLARITAVLRRTTARPDRPHAQQPYRFEGWILDPTHRRLTNSVGVEIALTGGEYDLLATMLDRPNRVLNREMLLDLLHNRQAGPFDRTIDVAVARLRRKLQDDRRHAQLIKTVRGGGYVLAAIVERG